MFANLHNLSHHAAWRRQLEMILESTGEGIYGIDLKGRCIFINEAGAVMLGYTPDEVLGRPMHYLIHHSHADETLMPVHECRIYQAFREGQGVRVDDEVLWRRDGSSFPAEYASYPIRDGETVVGAVVTFNDITERKRSARLQQEANDQLEKRVRERTAELTVAHDNLRQSNESLRRLAAHLNSVREEERRHIARDVHDELGAALTALQLEMSWLRHRLADDPALGGKLDSMLDIGDHAMQAVRRILNDLRPGILDHLGLWAALEGLLLDFQKRSGLSCSFVCSPEIERCRLGRDAEIALYRIVQEVLTNVSRHAQASRVELRVSATGRDLELLIADDGQGMRVPRQPTSFGLLGMRERTLALGGSLEIISSPGKGVRIMLRLPNVIA
ncbi:MAG: histidine kinase [Betaproteobacteria bacterium HGW-Betaproteobacteria-7]|nr:MAG: histidine kinase [Betaproteobacteria bacterium HGW-Betaproteobacteria-7]